MPFTSDLRKRRDRYEDQADYIQWVSDLAETLMEENASLTMENQRLQIELQNTTADLDAALLLPDHN